MTEDQVDQLKAISALLAQRVIEDCNPENWVGNGKTQSQMTNKERGDAYWCRRVAGSSVALLRGILQIVSPSHGGGDAADQLIADIPREVLIKNGEKSAAKLIKDVMKKSKA